MIAIKTQEDIGVLNKEREFAQTYLEFVAKNYSVVNSAELIFFAG